MRLVGSAASLISAAAAAGISRPSYRDDILYAAAFQLRPRLGANPINQALAVLSGALAKSHAGFKPLDRDTERTEVMGRIEAAHWQTETSGDLWMGELLWRHSHPTVAGVALTTHAVLTEQPGMAAMTLRVAAPGGVRAVLGQVGAGQAHPTFLADLNRLIRLIFDRLDGDPRTLGERDMEAFVSEVLVGDDRVIPVAVVSPTERGEYIVPPSQLAEELLGVAHLYVVDRHATTFRLSDALGDRRLACYWGALRAYLPGFSCADRPQEHPLIVADRLSDPVVRAQLRGALGLVGRNRVAEPPGVEALREAEVARREAAKAQSVKAASPAPTPPPTTPAKASEPAPPTSGSAESSGETPAAAPAAAGSPPPVAQNGAAVRVALEQLTAPLGRRLDDALAALEGLTKTNASLLDEIVSLRTTNAVRSATAAGLERRLADIEQLLREQLGLVEPRPEEAVEPRGGEPAVVEDELDEESEAITVASVVRQAAISLDDALLVLDEAVRAAEESPYRDVDRVAAVFDAMALVARRRQAGTLGASLRDAFRELGVDYRRGVSESTPERLRRQHMVRLSSGEQVEATEHIALGNSYDPRYCLRIYFTSRAPAEPRFVIAHVGRHLDVISTT